MQQAVLNVAVNHGAWAIAALFACPFAERFGCRITSCVGALLAGLFMVGCTFCQAEVAFLLTFGVMAGFWSGTSLWSTVVCLCQHFEEKRALAAGIGFSAGSLGTLMAGELMT